MTSDLALLKDYAENQVQASFTALVERHLDLVYSAALRQVRSPQLAEEIAQSVFADLARSADKLKPDTVLTAWLYQVTRRTAIDVVRRESRRQLREQVAAEMNAMNATADDWICIEPLLDDAMEALEETDRTAVLLRYFENQSLREVGNQLGISDDAAQKRVSRAVDRLREFFTKRGVTIGASGLVAVVSANAVQTAPAALAVTITSATALAGTAAVSVAATTTKAIAMTTLQKTLIGTTLAIVAGAGIYEARQASKLNDEVQSLQQQQAPLTAQVEQLNEALTAATNQVAGLRQENERLSRSKSELLKLRGEVTGLRGAARDLAEYKRVNQQLTTEISALRQQQPEQLSSEDLFKLRQLHAVETMGELMEAVKSYADVHGGRYPTGFEELRAAGTLARTNFAGGLDLNDFVFPDSGEVDPAGGDLILRTRMRIEDSQGKSVCVYGAVRDGVPSTITMSGQPQ